MLDLTVVYNDTSTGRQVFVCVCDRCFRILRKSRCRLMTYVLTSVRQVVPLSLWPVTTWVVTNCGNMIGRYVMNTSSRLYYSIPTVLGTCL